MRHFESGAARRAAATANIPIINAGDGPGQHPTQVCISPGHSILLNIFLYYLCRVPTLFLMFACNCINYMISPSTCIFLRCRHSHDARLAKCKLTRYLTKTEDLIGKNQYYVMLIISVGHH